MTSDALAVVGAALAAGALAVAAFVAGGTWTALCTGAGTTALVVGTADAARGTAFGVVVRSQAPSASSTAHCAANTPSLLTARLPSPRTAFESRALCFRPGKTAANS